MTDNLRFWTQFDDVDPKFTKAITGKDYKGTSPNPQYVIKCLTEMFGPVGQGFGWRVLEEGFQPLGETVLHWCRIEFWHTDKSHTWEAYGQTKAAYPTSSGSFRVDEDAPKKSLTDAIVKAASQVGVAANIFLGRWEDSRYVAQVNQEYREEEQAAPKPAAGRITAALDAIARETTLEGLRLYWADLYKTERNVADNPTVIAAKDRRKVAIESGAQVAAE